MNGWVILTPRKPTFFEQIDHVAQMLVAQIKGVEIDQMVVVIKSQSFPLLAVHDRGERRANSAAQQSDMDRTLGANIEQFRKAGAQFRHA